MNINNIFEDFERKYRGSYVQLLINGNLENFLLDDIKPDVTTKFPHLILQSNKFGSIILKYNTQERIFFKIPPPTYTQIGEDAYYFSRFSARQWKRGINSSNCRFYSPPYPGNNNIAIEESTIEKAFYPEKYSVTQAIDLIKNQNYNSVALSKNIAVFKKIADPNTGFIFYRFTSIGTLDFTSLIFDCPNFTREIRNELTI